MLFNLWNQYNYTKHLPLDFITDSSLLFRITKIYTYPRFLIQSFVCEVIFWKLLFVEWRLYFFRVDLMYCDLCIGYSALQIMEEYQILHSKLYLLYSYVLGKWQFQVYFSYKYSTILKSDLGILWLVAFLFVCIYFYYMHALIPAKWQKAIK